MEDDKLAGAIRDFYNLFSKHVTDLKNPNKCSTAQLKRLETPLNKSYDIIGNILFK
ncbi:hypothetical protein [Rouxiella badensis]|uniref:hypothetical protein n=1 Tax=Rouxiella badensis TaxID=1646377 RepID=UPI001787C260|nr:hypothetical protein [Rouxiella badensis]QOI58103.1 hypothetical protein H2866_23460 [Rouxiella badensis subsp. acadiensis]QOI58104.1 hypothetical protein H2866_23545 [Rouxiella badensis subsp. acadiensis]